VAGDEGEGGVQCERKEHSGQRPRPEKKKMGERGGVKSRKVLKGVGVKLQKRGGSLGGETGKKTEKPFLRRDQKRRGTQMNGRSKDSRKKSGRGLYERKKARKSAAMKKTSGRAFGKISGKRGNEGGRS